MQTGDYQFIGKGLYTQTEAYRLTHIPVRRIVRWTRGYTFRLGGQIHPSPPIIAHELNPIDGIPVLTFLDLMEIRFLDAFRSQGVSWKTIRISWERAKLIIKHSHPFSTKRFKTDGRTILAEFEDEMRDEKLLDLVKLQYAFRRIVSPLLYTGLEFNEGEEASRWWPMGKKGGVVIDPARSFGAPIVSRVGIPTRILMDSFNTSGSVEGVADWFDIKPKMVEFAINYERTLPT